MPNPQSRTFNVLTDMDPQTLLGAGMDIFNHWVKFAMGLESLGGKKLVHPTGRYASSISFKKYNAFHVAIISDEEFAPEGVFIEEGHERIDLLEHYSPGQWLQMHRGSGYGPPVLDPSKGGRTTNIWATVRAKGASGAVRVPRNRPARMNTSGTDQAWVIPRMPAYSPAAILAASLKART